MWWGGMHGFTSAVSPGHSCMHACTCSCIHEFAHALVHARMRSPRAARMRAALHACAHARARALCIHLRSRESPAHSSLHSRQAAVAGPPEPRYAGLPLRRPPSGCAYDPLRPNGRHGRPIGPRPGVAPGPARLSGAAPGESPHVPWVMPARSNACSGATSSCYRGEDE